MRLKQLLIAIFLVAYTNASYAAPQYREGGLVESTIINCLSIITGTPYPQNGVAVYVSYAWDGDALPKVGDLLAIVVTMANLGGHCSTPVALTTISLPSALTLYTDANGTYFNVCDESLKKYRTDSAKCVQLKQTVSGLLLTSPLTLDDDSSMFFKQPQKLPEKTFIKFLIPVVVTAPTNGAENIVATVRVADGNSSPTLVSPISILVEAPPTTTSTSTTTTTTTTTTTSVTTTTLSPSDSKNPNIIVREQASAIAAKIRKAAAGKNLKTLRASASRLIKDVNSLSEQSSAGFKKALARSATILGRVKSSSSVKKAKEILGAAARSLEVLSASISN